MKRNWASELRAIAEGRLLLNVRNGVTVSRSMLAMIADEIDALRATITPAEVGGLWVPANPEHAKLGWSYDFEQTERISRAAYDSTGYDATMEVVEFVMAEADRRHRDALTTERAAHAETKRERDEFRDIAARKSNQVAGLIKTEAAQRLAGARVVTDAMIEAGLEYYAEGGCGGLADHERREVVEAIIEAALTGAKP